MKRVLAALGSTWAVLLFGALGCNACGSSKTTPATVQQSPQTGASETAGAGKSDVNPITAATAVFAGGCFWCMQPPFDKTEGVLSTLVGYTGGPEVDPTYPQVSSGATGHREAIEVRFDAQKVTYRALVDLFWKNINPTDAGGQFADRGHQYTTAIFVSSDRQRHEAMQSKQALELSGKFREPIATPILEAGPFYPAEDYHQAYYKKNYAHYNRYRIGSGRQGYLERTWGTAH